MIYGAINFFVYGNFTVIFMSSQGTLVWTTILAGIIAGFLISVGVVFISYRYDMSQRLLDELHLELEGNETLLCEVAAHYTVGKKVSGGKLFKTDKRYVFLPHRYETTKLSLEIPLEDIDESASFKVLGILNIGFRLYQNSGDIAEFIVKRPVPSLFKRRNNSHQAHSYA